METIKLDLIPGKKMPSLHASQYDDGREHGIDLFENGIAYKLDGTETLTINERKVDNNICSMDIENTFSDSNHIVFASTEQMCAVWGNNICELVIAKGEKTIGTLNFILEIEQSPTEGGIESESEIKNLERQVEAITEEVIGDDYYTKTQTDEAIANATEGKADASYVNTELAKKADKTDTYTKTQVDNALNNKMNKANPTGTGSFSLNRKANTTIGNYSFVEGYNNEASGNYAHAENVNNVASGNYAHAEGYQNVASGINSHAEGYHTEASGNYSRSAGANAIASGNYSSASGNQTIANHKSQTVIGEYNLADDSTASASSRGNYVEIVGNGTSNNARSNARTLDWSGNETLAGNLTYNGNKSLASEISRLDGRIDNIPKSVIFKGTLGVGGTVESLPVASAENEGWMFKCITAGTYSGLTLKVGDTVTCFNPPNTSIYEWDKTGSEDTDTDTWRNIKVNGVEKLGNGISSGSVDFKDSSNVKFGFDEEDNSISATLDGIYTQAEVDTIVANAIDSVLPTDSVSKSAIANFTTSLAKPIEFEAEFGADAGGVDRITLFHLGANLWDEVTELGGISNTTGENTVDNSVCRSKNYIPVPVGENLYIANPNAHTVGLRFYDKDKAFIGSRAFLTSKAMTYGTNDLPTNTAYIRLVNTSSNTYANDLSINFPSSNTEYNAYNSNSSITTIFLGSTYYNGGTLTQDKTGHRSVTADGVTTDLSDGEPLVALIGTNNVFADTGDVGVSFKCSVEDYVNAHSGGGLRSLGNSNENLSKGGGSSEEEPTEESEETEKTKEIDEPKEEIKTIGDDANIKKIGGE